MVVKGFKDGDVYLVYKVFNILDYVVGNFGNYEFNYGLNYLYNVLVGVKFFYVNVNIIDVKI